MSDSVMRARIVNIHDVEENWKKASTFIPKSGEIVVYDVDEKHMFPRFKIGDGNTTVVDLPFSMEITLEKYFGENNGVIHLNGGNIKEYA